MPKYRVVVEKRPAFTHNIDGPPYMLWYVALQKKEDEQAPWVVYTWWFKEKDKEVGELVEKLKKVHPLDEIVGEAIIPSV